MGSWATLCPHRFGLRCGQSSPALPLLGALVGPGVLQVAAWHRPPVPGPARGLAARGRSCASEPPGRACALRTGRCRGPPPAAGSPMRSARRGGPARRPARPPAAAGGGGPRSAPRPPRSRVHFIPPLIPRIPGIAGAAQPGREPGPPRRRPGSNSSSEGSVRRPAASSRRGINSWAAD